MNDAARESVKQNLAMIFSQVSEVLMIDQVELYQLVNEDMTGEVVKVDCDEEVMH